MFIRNMLSASIAIAVVSGYSMAMAYEDNQSKGKPRVALEEVVVTGQKREEAAMDAALAIDTFTMQDVENTGALDLGDIDNYIPGFEMGEGITQVSPSIRGISSSNISSGGDSSVATSFNGVPVHRAANTIPFSDIERIEVMKGPQGTLSGRNAAAGSVSIVQNAPSQETEGFLKLQTGNYNFTRLEGMYNTPLADNLALRMNVLQNQRDSYFDNDSAGARDAGDENSLTAGATLLWSIGDDTEWELSYLWDNTDNGARPAIGFGDYSPNKDPFSRRYENDAVNEETREMYVVHSRISHAFSEQLSGSWILNHTELDTTNLQDEDGTALANRHLDTDNREDAEITYTELQFNYKADRFNLVFGGSYSAENKSQYTDLITNTDSLATLATNVANGILGELGAPGIEHIWNADDWAYLSTVLNGAALPQEDMYYQALMGGVYFLGYGPLIDAYGGTGAIGSGWIGPEYAGMSWVETIENHGDFQSWGIYGDMEYQATDRLTLSAGLRYTRDAKEFSWFNPQAALAATINATRDYYVSLAFLEPMLGAIALLPDATNVAAPLRLGEEIVTDTLVVAKKDWSQTTGRAVAKYQIADDFIGYLSYTTGYKSGGFESLTLDTSVTALEPEEIDNIELGLKGDMLDGRVRLQLAVFDMTVDGKQESISSKAPGSVGAVPTVINVDQEVDGYEISLYVLPLDTLRLGVLYTDRDSQTDRPKYYNSQSELVAANSARGSTATDYTLTLDWNPEVASGSLLVHLDYIFNENTSADDPNLVAKFAQGLPGFGEDTKLLNARLSWISPDSSYELALWGKNLLDNETTGIPGGFVSAPDTFAAPIVSVSDPRAWGIDLRYNF